MSTTQTNPNQLEERLISFAAAIVELSVEFPKTIEGRHIRDQILRSGTASAANYGEARGAESRADFIHKLKIVSKELNETRIWLEIAAKSSLFPAEKASSLISENHELCRIIGASIRTARRSSNDN